MNVARSDHAPPTDGGLVAVAVDGQYGGGGEVVDDPSEKLKRRQMLLRVLLCMLCCSVCLLLAGGVTLVLMLQAGAEGEVDLVALEATIEHDLEGALHQVHLLE